MRADLYMGDSSGWVAYSSERGVICVSGVNGKHRRAHRAFRMLLVHGRFNYTKLSMLACLVHRQRCKWIEADLEAYYERCLSSIVLVRTLASSSVEKRRSWQVRPNSSTPPSEATAILDTLNAQLSAMTPDTCRPHSPSHKFRP